MIDVKCIQLEDGLEYALIDEIENGDIKYCYLVNVNDENDFCIRKIDTKIDNETVIGLDSNHEFDKALLLFTKMHNKGN